MTVIIRMRIQSFCRSSAVYGPIPRQHLNNSTMETTCTGPTVTPRGRRVLVFSRILAPVAADAVARVSVKVLLVLVVDAAASSLQTKNASSSSSSRQREMCRLVGFMFANMNESWATIPLAPSGRPFHWAGTIGICTTRRWMHRNVKNHHHHRHQRQQQHRYHDVVASNETFTYHLRVVAN
jgi:hypothetical protein